MIWKVHLISWKLSKKFQIKYIYNIGEQTNELRAKLLTVENDVKLNSASVEKTRKYTELVHGAWQEALQLRQSLKVLRNSEFFDFSQNFKLTTYF